MLTTILEEKDMFALDLPMLRSFLKVPEPFPETASPMDAFLMECLKVATCWLEERLDLALIFKKVCVTHNNDRFQLPFGNVSRILEVSCQKRVLSPNDYSVSSMNGRTRIQLPFSWKSPSFKIIYETGFARTEDIPATLRQTLREVVQCLYLHDGDLASLEKKTIGSLTHAHRFSRLG